MITSKHIIELLDSRPFSPFRVVLTDGKTYDIKHREFIWVLPNSIQIAIPKEEGQTLVDHTHTVALLHVVRIEKADAPHPRK